MLVFGPANSLHGHDNEIHAPDKVTLILARNRLSAERHKYIYVTERSLVKNASQIQNYEASDAKSCYRDYSMNIPVASVEMTGVLK